MELLLLIGIVVVVCPAVTLLTVALFLFWGNPPVTPSCLWAAGPYDGLPEEDPSV